MCLSGNRQWLERAVKDALSKLSKIANLDTERDQVTCSRSSTQLRGNQNTVQRLFLKK